MSFYGILSYEYAIKVFKQVKLINIRYTYFIQRDFVTYSQFHLYIFAIMNSFKKCCQRPNISGTVFFFFFVLQYVQAVVNSMLCGDYSVTNEKYGNKICAMTFCIHQIGIIFTNGLGRNRYANIIRLRQASYSLSPISGVAPAVEPRP